MGGGASLALSFPGGLNRLQLGSRNLNAQIAALAHRAVFQACVAGSFAVIAISSVVLVVLTNPLLGFVLNELTGMYGPPPNCKRKRDGQGWFCANVYGLCWREDLLARMECATLSSHLVMQSWKTASGDRVLRAPV